jgi:signal transduction histidine kinase
MNPITSPSHQDLINVPPAKQKEKDTIGNSASWLVIVLMGMTYVTMFMSNATATVPRITGIFQMSGLILAGVGLAVLVIKDELWIGAERPWSTAAYFATTFTLFLLIGYFSQAMGQWWLAGLLIVGTAANLSNQWLIGVALGVLMSIVGMYYVVYLDIWVFYQLPLAITPAIFFVAIFTRLAVRERQARQEVELLAVELQMANHKLSEYAARVEELAIIQERNRMAREIHDSLGHYLTVVNVQIGAAQAVMEKHPARALDALQKAQKLTQEGLREVRHSVAALRETAEERPLPTQLDDLAAETTAAGLPTSLAVVGEPRLLPHPITRTLYRATQEALTNARKHSAATAVTCQLDYTNEKAIALTVQDNGRGSADPTGGYGLLGLRERVQLLGGEVAIETAEGAGFTVWVTLATEEKS